MTTPFSRWKESADWTRLNPILPSRTPGFERDTGKVKIGDGTKRWADLSYADAAPYTLPVSASESGELSSGSSDNDEEVMVWRPVASGVQPVNGTSASAVGSLTGGTGVKRLHSGPKPINMLKIKWGNFLNGGQESHASLGDITIAAATVEYPAGTFTPVFIAGGLTALMKPGSIIESDEVAVTIPPNTDFWIRTYCTWTASTNIALQAIPPQMPGQSVSLSATPTDKTTQVGSIGFDTVGPSPIQVLGLVPKSAKALLVMGDSITNGTGDFPDQVQGYVDRAADGLYAVQKISAPTTRAMWEATAAGRWRKARLILGVTSAYEGYGINDLANSRTVAQVQADRIAIWAWLRGIPGIRKVYAATLVPFVSSTNGYITAADQTPQAVNANRILLNDWLRDGAPVNNSTALTPVAAGTAGALRAGTEGHPLSGYVDVADTVEANAANALTRNGSRWKVGTLKTVTDAAITSGAKNLTSATAAFTAADVGRAVAIEGAGAAGARYLGAIVSITNGTTAVVSANAGTTVSGVVANIGLPTLDGTHPAKDSHIAMSTALIAALSALMSN